MYSKLSFSTELLVVYVYLIFSIHIYLLYHVMGNIDV